jgi:hypothetical protein
MLKILIIHDSEIEDQKSDFSRISPILSCMIHRLYAHLIFWGIFLGLTAGLYAQPVRFLEAYEDEDASIQSGIGEVLSDSLYAHPDSLLKQLPVIMAYHRWAQMARIEWSTPLVKRIEIWRRKAQSNFLIGMYQAYLIPKYARMESGALPLAQQSKSFLDSASVNYNKLLRHIVDQTKHNLKLDSAITVTLSHELGTALRKVEQQGYIQPLQQFNPDSLVTSQFVLYNRRDIPIIQNALGWWFSKAVVPDSAYIKKHELQDPTIMESGIKKKH